MIFTGLQSCKPITLRVSRTVRLQCCTVRLMGVCVFRSLWDSCRLQQETNLTLYGVVSSLYCLSGGLCCCIAMYFKGSREERWEALLGIKPYERSGSFWKYESVTFQCFSVHCMDKKHLKSLYKILSILQV